MLFTSLTFAVFFITVFVLYWFAVNKNIYHQNLLIVLVSYIFYGWWDWRFPVVLFINSLVNYFLGMHLAETDKTIKRKILLAISIIANIGSLAVFKYYNFFIRNFLESVSSIGINPHLSTLNIILPIGISFYTFQTLSYTIDIYRGKQEPSRDIIAFLAFVSFFPKLAAGPIERAANLLPQFHRTRTFRYKNARDGMQQILWGVWKKICVADVLARPVDHIFTHYTGLPGSTLVLGAVFFAFQVYCDFSAYSDIAIGTAKLLDFNLMTNFSLPYFSRNIREFWRRWHISLSSWFRDYVYIPLGGNRGSKMKTIFNVLVTFTLSGLWHGANWTYVLWGFLNGLYYIPTVLLRNKKHENTGLPVTHLIQMAVTFIPITLSWIFFRSDNLGVAADYINKIATRSLLRFPRTFIPYLIPIAILLTIEWVTRDASHPLKKVNSLPWVLRWGVYLLLTLAVAAAYRVDKSFIYFEF
jgi:alginate O-acetyltransferase complex protein AlgI